MSALVTLAVGYALALHASPPPADVQRRPDAPVQLSSVERVRVLLLLNRTGEAERSPVDETALRTIAEVRLQRSRLEPLYREPAAALDEATLALTIAVAPAPAGDVAFSVSGVVTRRWATDAGQVSWLLWRSRVAVGVAPRDALRAALIRSIEGIVQSFVHDRLGESGSR